MPCSDMVSVPLSDTNSFLDLICLSIQMVRLVIVLGGRVHKRKKKIRERRSGTIGKLMLMSSVFMRLIWFFIQLKIIFTGLERWLSG